MRSFRVRWIGDDDKRRGFTLVELLVVIAVIAILAALLLPALSKGKQQAWKVTCLNNLRQLELAWNMYAGDSGGSLPLNQATSTSSLPGSWIVGDPRLDSAVTNLEQGTLFAYTRSHGIYHCPADPSTTTGTSNPRAVSYTMNNWLNSGDFWVPVKVRKYSDLVRPGPAGTFVFVHENEDSVDNGHFGTYWPGVWSWMNYPTSRHNRGCTFSFADGHVEYWKWRGNSVHRFEGYGAPAPVNDVDLQKVQSALPSK